MKFKLDENLPVELAQILQQEGYDATTVHEENLAGEADATIIQVCLVETRILVTLDLDFADIRSYPPHLYAGIIVLRLQQQDKPHVMTVFQQLLPLLKSETITQKLWIVDEKRIRVRE